MLLIINEKQQRRSLEIIEEVISPRSVSDKSEDREQDDHILLQQNVQVVEIAHMGEEVKVVIADEETNNDLITDLKKPVQILTGEENKIEERIGA